MLSFVGRQVSSAFAKRPMVANFVAGGALGAGGDIICQNLIEGAQVLEMDAPRFTGMTTFSAFYASTFSVWIFGLYPRILPKSMMKSRAREGIASSLLDCCVHSPILYLPAFYVWTGAFQGRTPSQSIETYKKQFKDVMTSLIVIWIPVQTLNFSIVPRPFRVVFVNAANLVWNAVLDYLHHRGT